MEHRILGQTGINASVLGFGCSHIASLRHAGSRKIIESTLLRALEIGINFFDTADSYTLGNSERLLGRILRKQRDRVVICSKAGYEFGYAHSLRKWIQPKYNKFLTYSPWNDGKTSLIRNLSTPQNFSPGYLKKAIEQSLHRLGTDYLDIFFLHSPDPQVLLNNSVFETLERMKEKGSIRNIGVSCAHSEDALLCFKNPSITVLQLPVNPFDTVALQQILPQAWSNNFPIVARQPFASGRVFTLMSSSHGKVPLIPSNPSQIFLKFVTQCQGVGTVVTGMTSQAHLMENYRAVAAVPLTEDEHHFIQQLGQTFAPLAS